MAGRSSEITDIIKAQIQRFEGKAESVDVGTVVEIGDGIARIHGLAGCKASELLDFGRDTFGLAFNLEEDTVSAIILGEYDEIKEGDEVRTTGRIIETPAGPELVGRVVDPLGRPLDGKGPINAKAAKRVDALVVYDDLTKHAWAYRQVSLLVRRPPGREAYPGDVFYLHSRLLERAARMNKENGGGSLTPPPVIETPANDISAYIPTNVISITDGQLFMEPDLFNAGFRPAINPGLSVSRVGGDARTKPMSRTVRGMQLQLQQFRELAAFTQFGASDLDKATLQTLRRGERIQEVLKQPQYEPVSLQHEIAILFAANRGYLDDVPKEKVGDFERDLRRYMDTQGRQLSQRLLEKPNEWNDDVENQLKKLVEDFKKAHGYGEQAKPAAQPAAA